MILKKAEFISFRNIENETVVFNRGINVIYGENAQGKTNILEGIYLFARGKSFRATKDKELIQFGKDTAYSKIFFEREEKEEELGVEITKNTAKKFYRNKVKVQKTADIIGDFHAVLFCPSHLGIICDSPSVRRKFLDVAISQIKPVYIKKLYRYNFILEERNSILKMSEEERKQYSDVFDYYSDELASISADIAVIRNEYIIKLDKCVKNVFFEMTEDAEKPKISYENNIKEEDFGGRDILYNKYRKLLFENRDKEIRNSATLYGIHKDDLKIEINSKDSRLYASQGQQRSLALAMKLAEGEISREYSGEYPVFLLDDVLSELDNKRREYFMSNINDKQVIITSCEPDLFSDKNKSEFICVKDGKIFR